MSKMTSDMESGIPSDIPADKKPTHQTAAALTPKPTFKTNGGKNEPVMVGMTLTRNTKKYFIYESVDDDSGDSDIYYCSKRRFPNGAPKTILVSIIHN